jgi:hypothetical protein
MSSILVSGKQSVVTSFTFLFPRRNEGIRCSGDVLPHLVYLSLLDQRESARGLTYQTIVAGVDVMMKSARL